HVAAWANGGDMDRLRADALDILHRMDAEIDVAVEKGAVEFLGPQSLAAELIKRAVLHLVAGRRDGDQLDIAFGPALGGFDRCRDLARLGEGQGRSASPELEAVHASASSALRRLQAKGRRRNDIDPRT